MIQEIKYDTFGSILRETGEGFVLPFGFAGELHDRDTGLVCFGVRDYLPEQGRFMAKAPLGLKGGDPDVYEYCLDDPMNRVDPSGMSWEQVVNAGRNIMAGTKDAVGKGVVAGTEAVLKGGAAGAAAVAKTANVCANDPQMREAYTFGAKVAAPALALPFAIAGGTVATAKTRPSAISWGLANAYPVTKAVENIVDAMNPNPPTPLLGSVKASVQSVGKAIGETKKKDEG